MKRHQLHELHDQIRKMFSDGVPLRELRERFGYTRQYLARIIAGGALRPIERSRYRQTVVTTRNVKMFQDYQNGMAVSELAAQHAVSKQRVHQIVQEVATAQETELRPGRKRKRPNNTALDKGIQSAMAQDHRQGMPIAQIAARYGYSSSTVYRVLKKHGLTKRRDKVDEAAVVRDYLKGLSVAEIADRQKCCPATVRRYLDKQGLPRPQHNFDHAAIIEDRLQGLKIAEISHRHKCSLMTVNRCLKQAALTRGYNKVGNNA